MCPAVAENVRGTRARCFFQQNSFNYIFSMPFFYAFGSAHYVHSFPYILFLKKLFETPCEASF